MFYATVFFIALFLAVSSGVGGTQEKENLRTIAKQLLEDRSIENLKELIRKYNLTPQQLSEIEEIMIEKVEADKKRLKEIEEELNEKAKINELIDKLQRESIELKKELEYRQRIDDELSRIIDLAKKVWEGTASKEEIEECSRFYDLDCSEYFPAVYSYSEAALMEIIDAKLERLRTRIEKLERTIEKMREP